MTDSNNELIQYFKVDNTQSAQALGSGGLLVLGTPALVAYMENVAFNLAQQTLSEKDTTVGIEMNLKHLAPSAIGADIQVKAQLIKQEKSILTYEIVAYDTETLIGKATHKRAIVNVDKFMARLK